MGDLIISANGVGFKSISHEDAKRVMLSARDSLAITVRRYIGKVHIVQVRKERYLCFTLVGRKCPDEIFQCCKNLNS